MIGLRKGLLAVAAVGLLSLQLAPVALAGYSPSGGSAQPFGPLSGDITTPSAGSTVTTLSLATRTVTAAGTVQVAASDRFLCINKTTGAPTTINGLATPQIGVPLTIKDCKGDAATNAITFTPGSGITIDGQTSANVISSTAQGNFGAVNIIYTSATTAYAY